MDKIIDEVKRILGITDLEKDEVTDQETIDALHSQVADLVKKVEALKPTDVHTDPAPHTDPVVAKANPFSGATLYTPKGGVVRDFIAANPHDSSVSLLQKITNYPNSIWLSGGSNDEVYKTVLDALTDAAGKLVTFVVYNIPGRDNGSYSAGGADTAEAYYSWIGTIEAAVVKAGNPDVVFFMEPDILGILSNDQRRFKVMEYISVAMDILAKEKNRYLYLDHSGWISPDDQLRLWTEIKEDNLLGKMHGFTENVSGYDATADVISRAEVLALKSGKPYVIDTSRNGNGPSNEQPDAWCNPTGRALGATPLHLSVGNAPHMEANLWIKPAGESDGTCRGGTPAGQFFKDRAVEMAHNASF